jgi:hypothetical protein
MRAKPIPAMLLYLAGAAGASGCNSESAPRSTSTVDFRMAASTAALSGSAGTPAQITSLRLVVGPAALGVGDQFGCIDCQGGDSEAAPRRQLVTVPPDGSPVLIKTEPVAAGSYSSAEIELLPPDPGLLAATPGWPADATIEIAGAINGSSFLLHLPVVGAFREALNPPLEVTDGTTPATVSVTVTLPVGSWFVSQGVSLDPNDPGQRAQIERNARASLQPTESGESPQSEGKQ